MSRVAVDPALASSLKMPPKRPASKSMEELLEDAQSVLRSMHAAQDDANRDRAATEAHRSLVDSTLQSLTQKVQALPPPPPALDTEALIARILERTPPPAPALDTEALIARILERMPPPAPALDTEALVAKILERMPPPGQVFNDMTTRLDEIRNDIREAVAESMRAAVEDFSAKMRELLENRPTANSEIAAEVSAETSAPASAEAETSASAKTTTAASVRYTAEELSLMRVGSSYYYGVRATVQPCDPTMLTLETLRQRAKLDMPILAGLAGVLPERLRAPAITGKRALGVQIKCKCGRVLITIQATTGDLVHPSSKEGCGPEPDVWPCKHTCRTVGGRHTKGHAKRAKNEEDIAAVSDSSLDEYTASVVAAGNDPRYAAVPAEDEEGEESEEL